MNTGPGGRTAPGHLRASDADRDRVVDELKTAFAQGRLAKDEFDRRLGQALTSRTYADLTTVVIAIRSAPPAPRPRLTLPVLPPLPPRRPVRARRRVSKKVVATSAAVVLLPGAAAAFLTSWGGFFVIFLLAFAAMVVMGGPSAPCRPIPGAARARFHRG